MNKIEKSKLFWRVAISTVGVVLILMAVGNLLLFIFGGSANAAFSTRRYGGERVGAVNDKRYTWYVDYTFQADNGKIYEGHLTKLGSATSVSVENPVYYFTFAPFLNTTGDTAKPNAGQIVMIAAGIFCLLAMNGNFKRNKTRDVKLPISDYDDSIENNFYQMEDAMSNFCSKCGSALLPEARFCNSCGAKIDSGGEIPVTKESSHNPNPLIGWTSHHLDPVVIQRAGKNKRNAWIFTIILTIFFPAGFTIAGILMDDMPLNEAVIIGTGLGVLMLIIGIVRISRMKFGVWEGVVIDKHKKQKIDNSQDDSIVRYKTVYTIVVTQDSGKKHTLRYVNNPAMYNYFNVGDKIRCHLPFGTYEKFDKSRDSSIYCNICGTVNDIAKDNCKYCRLPLFK